MCWTTFELRRFVAKHKSQRRIRTLGDRTFVRKSRLRKPEGIHETVDSSISAHASNTFCTRATRPSPRVRRLLARQLDQRTRPCERQRCRRRHRTGRWCDRGRRNWSERCRHGRGRYDTASWCDRDWSGRCHCRSCGCSGGNKRYSGIRTGRGRRCGCSTGRHARHRGRAANCRKRPWGRRFGTDHSRSQR